MNENSGLNRAKLYQLALFPMNNGATNVYFVLILSYVATFGENILGLIGFASIMVTVMRLFDAVTDPIIGALMDKTSTKFGKSIRGFNALCEKGDEVSEEHIAAIEATRAVPADLRTETSKDPFYDEIKRIHFRRTSGNVRLTIFEGGHSGNFTAGFDFLSRQCKGTPVDWGLPEKASAKTEALSR